MTGLFSTKTPTLGLDFGAGYLRVVQLKIHGGTGSVVGFNALPLSPSAFAKEGIKDRKTFGATIKKAMSEARPHPITAKAVMMGLPESLVFTKTFDVPIAPKKELAQTVPTQAGEFFPIPPDDLVVDWQLVQTLKDKKQYHVVAVGAPKKLIEENAALLKECGLELLGAETKLAAAARAVVPAAVPKMSVLVDIGPYTTAVGVLSEGTMQLSGTVAVGNLQFGKALGDENKELLELITKEVVNLVRYFANRIQNVPGVDVVYLTGPGSNAEGLPEMLKQLLNMPVERANALTRLRAAEKALPEAAAREMAVAIGLALKEG